MTSTPITESDVAQRVREERLSVREKIGYGLGDAGGTVITCLIMNFLTFFYTGIFGLRRPAVAGGSAGARQRRPGLSTGRWRPVHPRRGDVSLLLLLGP